MNLNINQKGVDRPGSAESGWRHSLHWRPARANSGHGFTLVEVLIVIGIISVLTALLLPAVTRVRERANQIACESNLDQIGISLLAYANESGGWLFPVGPPGGDGLSTTLGTTVPRERRWPVYVFGQWNPRIMLCPSDDHPAEEHSYLLNEHLADHKVKYSTTRLGGLYSSDVVVMGEKVSGVADYFMEEKEFSRVVEPFRHGLWYGSNYLYLDLHVSPTPPAAAREGIDPWDIPVPLPPPQQ